MICCGECWRVLRAGSVGLRIGRGRAADAERGSEDESRSGREEEKKKKRRRDAARLLFVQIAQRVKEGKRKKFLRNI